MRRSAPHTVEVQLTREEYRTLHELAALRGQTAPDFVRDALRLGPLRPPEHKAQKKTTSGTSRHLELVSPSPSPSTGSSSRGCA